MRFRFVSGAVVLTAVLGLAGCDTGGGSSPKVDTKGVQFKEKAPPASPGGEAPAKKGGAPGGGAASQ